MDKNILLGSIREGIEKARKEKIQRVHDIASNPEKEIERVNTVMDNYLRLVIEVDKWRNSKFQKQWDDLFVSAGTGSLTFLKDLLNAEKARKELDKN
jgi:hypothetical protein